MAKIFVIAGHGAGNSGSCGHGYQEQERVRKLAQRIKDFGGDNVLLGDFSRNYYADNGINNLTISKEYKIVELHMDSSNSPDAKGGHVIIKAGFMPDAYDKALEALIVRIFPGRSVSIDGRDDLANPSRAANRGYNYRLLECGFISNANDVHIFNSRMDELAKGILSCFNIGATDTPSTPINKPNKPTGGYTGNSLVDYLVSVGKKSDFNSRATYARQYGISNYTGTANQNLSLLAAMRDGKPSAPTVSYYPAFNSGSIVDGLQSIGINSDYANRVKIARANGFQKYTGTARQNSALCDLARKGRLKRA